MTLDKRHMAGSLTVLVCAIAYNVWVFTRPDTGVKAAVVPAEIITPVASPGTGEAHAPALDPAHVTARADVAIDRHPEWPRDPFASLQGAPEPVEEAASAPPPSAEPDPVVASILHSPGRRLAVIDGRIVRPGDRAGSATVVDILPKAVIVERADGGRRTLDLQTPSTIGAGR